MKKMLISLTALTLLLAVVNAYACGDHEKADMNSSKAEATVGNSQAGSVNVTAAKASTVASAQKGQDAKYMTTEAHGCRYSDGSYCPPGACKTSTSGQAKESSAKADKVASKDSKPAEKSQVTPVVAAPVDLSSSMQK
jgi:hypothetical protein